MTTAPSSILYTKPLLRVLLVTALILLIPILGNTFVEGWNWSAGDFLGAFVFLFGAGTAYVFITARSKSTAYKFAVALGALGALTLMWVNGAVGIIGNEDNPANLLYAAVLVTGFLGAALSMFRPRGMSYTMFAAAVVQFLVPFAALAIFRPDAAAMAGEPFWQPGMIPVFFLNAGWVGLFMVSGMLFQHAASEQK